MEKEIWKQIPMFPTYAASNKGRIKNIKRNTILCQNKNDMTRDYQKVTIYHSGKNHTKKVARMVWAAFNGCECSKTINHIDNNPYNNQLKNLECISNKENCGKKNIYRKKDNKYGLTEQIRKDIVNQYNSGQTLYFLSKKYNLPSNYLYTTFRRGSWNYLCWKDDIENLAS